MYDAVYCPILQASSTVWYKVYDTFSLLFVGLTSFYTEMMRGIGASSRLWYLTDRKPIIPTTGLSAIYLYIYKTLP